jgi:hypothetical protein
MDIPPLPPHPLDALVTYELRDYRHQLEHALQALPATAPARRLLQQRLTDVLDEQQSRITIAAEPA